MKNPLRALRLCLVLLMSMVVLTGCGAKGVTAGQAFADIALQEITKDWDEKVLEQYAGKDFYAQCPKPQAKEICKVLKERLGVLKTYKSSKMDGPTPTPTAVAGEKAPLLLRFNADVDFEKGPGTILVVVAEKDGRWTLNGFQVSSPLLQQAPPPAPRQAPRPAPAHSATPASSPTP